MAYFLIKWNKKKPTEFTCLLSKLWATPKNSSLLEPEFIYHPHQNLKQWCLLRVLLCYSKSDIIWNANSTILEFWNTEVGN